MCGISSFLGNKNKTPDLLKLKLTSIANDSRGGHGVGVWANLKPSFLLKEINYTNFSDLYEHVHFKNKSTQATCIISHTRFATKGSKTNENLHPFVLGDGKFVFCHNGTIYNILDLIKKYPIDVDTNDKVDSFLLANIIYKYGYNVLKEYRGKAALVWTDNGGETLKVFKGESLSNLNVLSEERPLFGVYLPEGLYLSSLKKGLNFICNAQENKEIFDIATNCIFEFKNNEVINSIVIDRSNCFQDEERITFTSNTYWNNTSSKSNDLTLFSDKFKLKFEDGYFKTQYKSELLHGVYQTDEKVRKFNRLTKYPEDFNTNPKNFPYLLIFNKGVWINVESSALTSRLINKNLEFSVTNILNLTITNNEAEMFSLVPIKYYNSWYRPNRSVTEFALPPMFSDTLKYIESTNSIVTLKSLQNSSKQLMLPLNAFEEKNLFTDKMIENTIEYDLEKVKKWYCFNFNIDNDLLDLLLNKTLNRFELYTIINASTIYKTDFFDLMIDISPSLANSRIQGFSSAMFNLVMNEMNKDHKSISTVVEEFIVEQYLIFSEDEEDELLDNSLDIYKDNPFDPDFEHFSNFNY